MYILRTKTIDKELYVTHKVMDSVYKKYTYIYTTHGYGYCQP